jgi:hypothetical protein
MVSLSQFLLLPQLPQKMKLASKVVEFVSKSSARNQRSKFVKLAVIGIQEAKIGTTKSWKTKPWKTKLLERSRIIQGLKVILVLYEKSTITVNIVAMNLFREKQGTIPNLNILHILNGSIPQRLKNC